MRSLVYVAMQQARREPARRGDLGARSVNPFKLLSTPARQRTRLALPGCNLVAISAKFRALSQPFDLVPFRGAAHVLWLTTDRMRIDMLFLHENYGTVN